VVAGFGSPLLAQDRTVAIDRIFEWASPTTPGGVIAVRLDGELVVHRAYGLADLERGVAITPGTIFDAASVTKQFVAAAVLMLVEEGRLSLTEDIHTYVPELPPYAHTITLDHLLTHTSGIRDWTGLYPLAADDPDALTLTLRQRGLSFAPGEEWSYSNSGYVLLKEIVARVSGTTFSEFVQERIFEPLKMESTRYLANMREEVPQRALAYENERGAWTLDVKLDNDRGGGGGLLSTASDLLLWNQALSDGALGAFVTDKLHQPATLNNGRTLGYARGLMTDAYRGAQQVWHSGGSGGYGTWLGRYPEHGLSIAVMHNAGETVEASELAHRVFDLFVPDAPAEDPESGPPPALTGDALAQAHERAGLFFNQDTGEPMRLAVDRDRFRVLAGPGLVANGEDGYRRWGAGLFFMSGDRFELRFLSENEFELKSMEGIVSHYRRATPFAPTADDLAAFAGRYESDEVGSVLHVEATEGGLSVRLDHAPERRLELKPAHTDTFIVSRMMVRFVRGDAGVIVGLDYSNPAVRHIRFNRIGGG
jgi:CubicO group peptidase (beta-lactamase class C family)